MGGIAHQTAWLASSPESFFELKRADLFRSDFKQFQFGLQVVSDDARGDVEKVRGELRQPENRYFRRSNKEQTLLEKYNCLLIVDGSGKLAGAIMFPRERSGRQSYNPLFYWMGSEEEFLPMTNLPELLKKHQGYLLAL